MKLQVTTKNVYGNEAIYPVNAAAKAIAEIAGTKTLRLPDLLIALTALGCTLEYVGSTSTGHVSERLTRIAANDAEALRA